MLLHLGEDRSLHLGRIEALLDFRLFLRNPANREFLQLARSEGRLDDLSPGLSPETLVVAGSRVILSAVSRQTLGKRAGADPTGKRDLGTKPS